MAGLAAPATAGRADLESYISARTQLVSASTICNDVAALHAFFAWLQASGVRPDNPAAELRHRRPDSGPQPGYSQTEVERLLAACRTHQERLAVSMLAETGLRASELVTLRVEQIDRDALLARVNGKGGKRRLTPLGTSTAALLPHEGWVLPSRQGGHISVARLEQMIATLGQRAGVRRATPHRFRRYFADRFLSMGGDPGALQQALGHSTLAMSLRYAAWNAAKRALVIQRQMVAG